MSCPASPTFVGIVLEGLRDMVEEAIDPRPEFSGLYSWSQTASGYKGSQRAALWTKIGERGRSGWTTVRVPSPPHWETGPGLHPLWET